MANKMIHEQLSINEENPIIARHYDYNRFYYPWHFHGEYEIIYVKESCGERFVADNMEHFSQGDVILLGDNVPHYMKSAEVYYKENSPLRVQGVVIQFAADYMSHAINNYSDLSHIKSLLKNSKRGIHFPYPGNYEIIELIEKLPHLKNVERIANLLFLLDKMAKLKSKRFLGSPYFDQNLSTFTDDRLKKVLSYIAYHYTEELTLSKMASFVSMNESAFSRYFKEKTGKSFIDYILDLRIGYACKLLISSSFDISQIGLECGFNSICHFNKIFKRITGLTPTEYKKRFLSGSSTIKIDS